ncbi:bifunctional uridylyltransferase/uridylyl-removing protein GlnD [Planctomycetaceae bacterium SH139]
MAAQPTLPSVIQAARNQLCEGRVRLRVQHEAGSPGLQLTHLQTDLVDGLILDLYNTALRDLGCEAIASQVALVAHGGYGRRDLAPYSDCDLMLTPLRRVEKQVQPLAARLSRDIVDIGLDLGFTVRRPEQACQWAWRDPTVFTSLSEARLLTGSVHVFCRFFHNLRLGAMRRHRTLIDKVYQSRREERGKWGDTVYLLRPNVKRSRGGLRDIQLIRWLGFARFGDSDLDKLLHLGALSPDDYQRLRKALAFLLRLRNELHFDTGKSQDILDRPAQMRIAQRWGYQSEAGRLPVEAFMQDYFEHTRDVRYVAAHFVDTVRHRPLTVRSLDMLLSRRLGDDFRIGPYHIWVKEAKLSEVAGDVTRVLKLMELANRYQRRISHRTWQAIREAMRGRNLGGPDSETIALFLALLNRPGRLADLLRRLHELRVLEQIIPAMRHARCLLQFNQYHKYTVDAHSIRAVEAATQLTEQTGPAADLYKELDQPWLLHLSLLIHDLGKGFERDHSELGKEIAGTTADILQLQPADKKTLEALVYHHLLMIHTALRHDLSDQDVISQFAETIGSIEVLDLLYIHSLCDLTAVGPDVLTDWKQKLITELHQRVRRYLIDGGSLDRTDQRISRVRQQIHALLCKRQAGEAALRISEELPLGMLDGADANTLVDEIVLAASLTPEAPVRCWGRELENQHACEYKILFLQGERRVGLFMALTGALMSQGLEILRSQIESLPSGLAWDQFVVRDPNYEQDVPAERMEQVCEALRTAIIAPPVEAPRFRRVWGDQQQQLQAELRVLPSRVTFDNSTSERYTVLSVYAYDRPGLLYAVAKAIAQLKLVIHFAKIATHLDQAVDVFYVTYLDGRRIVSPTEQDELRSVFIEAVERG